jgi:hypothetical protein
MTDRSGEHKCLRVGDNRALEFTNMPSILWTKLSGGDFGAGKKSEEPKKKEIHTPVEKCTSEG